jgi:hypothetical protein
VVVRLGPVGQSLGDPSALGSRQGPRSVARKRLGPRQEDLTYEGETGEHHHQPDPVEITSRLAPEEQGTRLTIGLDARYRGLSSLVASLRG